jgi:outer membrane protein TolC
LDYEKGIGMKRLRYIYLLVMCLIFPLHAESLNLTLQDAITLAKQQNLSLQVQAVDLQQAKRDVDTSWNLFLPSINLSLSHGGNSSVFSTSTHMISGLSAGLQVEFPLNLALKDQLASYDLAYSVQQVTYHEAESEIERAATKLFYYLIAEQKNLELQYKNLELTQKQYGSVVAQYESGYVPELEMLSAELKVQQLLPSIQQSEHAYNEQLLAFKALLGLDLETDIVLDGELPNWKLTQSNEDLMQRLDSTRSMQLFDLNAASLQAGKEAKRKAELTPTLMISGGYTINTEALSVDPVLALTGAGNWSDTVRYSISLVIPLDSHIPGSAAKVGLAKMEDSLRKLQLEKQQARVQQEQNLITQVQKIQNLAQQMQVAQRNIDLAKQVYGMYQAQYDAGYADILSVDRAQQDVFSAEQNLVYLEYQYASALVDLAAEVEIKVHQL